jgi:CDP-2,3-bis-(O-geranylgeranyl)-sn-glycerol synthase
MGRRDDLQMPTLSLAVRLLCLLGVANSTPILGKRLFGGLWSAPLDGGLRFVDGRPLLGPSKTVRGVALAIGASAAAAPLLGVPGSVGALVGAGAMAGDALSSFVKRRLGIPSSGRAAGLDQIPEALLPLLATRASLRLSAAQIVGVTFAFLVLEPPLAHLAFRLRLRDQPY